jgi:HlyD family secretion protein
MTEKQQKKKLFRDDVLDRLSSPEQLDTRLVVVKHYGWLALMVSLSLLSLIIVWSFVGSLSTKVTGDGIILGKGGSLAVIPAPKSGKLLQLMVSVGDEVTAGQILANIEQPEVRQQLVELKRKRRELYFKWRSSMENYSKVEFRLGLVLEFKKSSLQQNISVAEDKLVVLAEMLKSRQGLLKQGYVTPSRVEEIRDQIFGTRDSINTAKTSLRNLDLELLNTRSSKISEISAIDSQILEVESQIESVKVALLAGSEVTSGSDGRIVGLLAVEGDKMQEGRPLLTMEVGGVLLQALIYVPATEGKLIEKGMMVQLSPSTHKKEEYGYLKGQVASVSLVPTSTTEMMKDLGDQRLADQFSEKSSPLLVRVDFDLDTSTVSGLAWSSAKGSDIDVSLGTLSNASVIIRKQKPIELVVPTIRKWVGI